jgi:hypothetical protein
MTVSKKQSLITISVLAISMAVVACDQKPSSTTSGGTTAPAGGAKSLPGKVVETTKDVVNRANEAGKKVGEAADSVGDTAKGAWADLRTAAFNEGDKRAKSFKAKVQELQTSNPALFTSVNEVMKNVEGKLGELKTAGVDAWKPLADQVKAGLDDVQKRLGM